MSRRLDFPSWRCGHHLLFRRARRPNRRCPLEPTAECFPSIPDQLIAAAAELGALTVLHVDKDFDLIAEFTGQLVQRLDA